MRRSWVSKRCPQELIDTVKAGWLERQSPSGKVRPRVTLLHPSSLLESVVTWKGSGEGSWECAGHSNSLAAYPTIHSGVFGSPQTPAPKPRSFGKLAY